MWLTKNIEEQTRRQRTAEGAQVTSSANAQIDANGTKTHASLPCVAPYGVASLMPSGNQAILIPLDAGSVALGVIQPKIESLEQGEIMLYSAGGATLVLKNDGTVVANGKVIA